MDLQILAAAPVDRRAAAVATWRAPSVASKPRGVSWEALDASQPTANRDHGILSSTTALAGEHWHHLGRVVRP